MELKITFRLQAKMNLPDDEFNRTMNMKSTVSCSLYIKKRRANSYLYYLKPNRLSKMMTRVLIFIVESRSVEHTERNYRFVELLIFAEVEMIRTSGKLHRGSETISLGSLELQSF